MSKIRLDLIYILTGVSTLLLNLILTLHIIRKNSYVKCRDIPGREDIITFRLDRNAEAEGATTVQDSCGDTVSLE